MTGEQFECPRRTPGHGMAGPDTYRPGRGLVGQARGCSYCGSMPPDDFMTAVRAGAEVEPTDKTYKLYVNQPNSDPDTLHPCSGYPFGDTYPVVTFTGGHVYTWADMPEELHAEAEAMYDPTRYERVGFAPRPTLTGKFYTPHLSDEQGREFFALWTAEKINWGYPGYPYARLYLPGLAPAAPEGAPDDPA